MVDFLLSLIYIVLAIALGAVAWAVVRTARMIGRTSGKSNGIPVRKINITVWLLVICLMVLTFSVSSTEPIRISTHTYTDTFWLRMSNMFVITGLAAILVAAITMAFSFLSIEKKSRGVKATNKKTTAGK